MPLLEDRTRIPLAFAELRGRFMPVLAALALGAVLLAGLFFQEIRAAVTTWNTSTAYGHCYLVLPMALYLIWDRRAVLDAIPARPELRFAAPGAAGCGGLAGCRAARHHGRAAAHGHRCRSRCCC